MNRVIIQFFGIFIFFFSIATVASSFKGYKSQPDSKVTKLTETIERLSETQDDILILISRHSAFYRFPKNLTYADQVRIFLKNRIKLRSSVVLEIDPINAEILTIGDAK